MGKIGVLILQSFMPQFKRYYPRLVVAKIIKAEGGRCKNFAAAPFEFWDAISLFQNFPFGKGSKLSVLMQYSNVFNSSVEFR